MIHTLKEEGDEDLEIKEDCEKTRAKKTREAILASRSIDETTDAITKLLAEIAEIKAENKAKDVLESFYKDNDLVLAQQPRNKASATPPPSNIAAGTQGQAPPPPPSTWNQPYGGKTQESGGISSVMQMLADDIQKDMDKAKAEEEKAIEEHDTFLKETEASIEDLETAITDLEATMSEKAQRWKRTKPCGRRRSRAWMR